MVDEIIPEPLGGAHRNHEEQMRLFQRSLQKQLHELTALSSQELRKQRYEKFRAMGQYTFAAEQLLNY